jgi:Na+/melibiose symporter-like transporter
MAFEIVIAVLQLALGPVTVISGAGLILLSLTNRLARVIDRGRQLANEVRHSGNVRPHAEKQLEILKSRAKLLKRAIVMTTVSVFLVVLLIAMLFLLAFLRVENALAVVIIFLLAMSCLSVGMLFFLQELSQSLKAFALDTEASTKAEI